MQKKKLAILINALEVAGAEKVVSLIINHFHKEFEIQLLLLNNTIQFELPVSNITVKTIDNSNLKARNRIKDILKIPLLSYRLKKYLKQNDIPVCFSALNRSNFINCFLRILKWNGKILISERSHTSSVYPIATFAGKTGRFLVKTLYKNADFIIPNSYGIEFDLNKNFKLQNKFCVIYNPVNIAVQENDMQVPVEDIAFDSFTFSHVARLEKGKNHAVLLAAIHKIKDKDFKVLIIGQGQQEEKIKQQALAMGISDKIIFLGYRLNVVKYIAKSQCHIMTSDFEGFPNVLLEALACNTAIISTDCPTGPRELLTGTFDPHIQCRDIEKGKYGLLVPINDADTLAKAMLLIMDDSGLRTKYAEAGKNRAKDFDLEIIMNQYANLFNSTELL